MKLINAVGYCRFSSDNQSDASAEAQELAIRNYAKQNDIVLIHVYTDKAQSGTNDNRREFQQMITDSKKKEFNQVLVYQFDRFARNKEDSFLNKFDLRKNGVKVVSITERIEDTPEGAMMETMLEGMADYYSKDLARKTTRGLKYNAEQGFNNGGTVPFGYMLVPRLDNNRQPMLHKKGHALHDLVKDPMRAEAVKIMFDMSISGNTREEIINRLNELGFKRTVFMGIGTNRPKVEVDFTGADTNIDNILRNEIYTGVYVYDTNKKRRKQNATLEPEIVRVEKDCLKIISQETFEAVQIILSSRKHRRSSKSNVDYLLTGKIVCGECGSVFNGCTHYKNEKEYFYYRCARVKDQNCKVSHISKVALENFVMREMANVIHSEEFVSQILDRFAEFYKERNSNSELIKGLEEKKKEVDKKIDNIVNAIANSGNFSTVFQSKLDELTNEQTTILASLKRESGINFEEFISKEQLRRTYFKVLGLLESGETQDKVAIINTLLNKVIVFKDRVEVFINILPLADASAELQITDKDLATYGLLEPAEMKKAAKGDFFRVKNCVAPHNTSNKNKNVYRIIISNLVGLIVMR